MVGQALVMILIGLDVLHLANFLESSCSTMVWFAFLEPKKPTSRKPTRYMLYKSRSNNYVVIQSYKIVKAQMNSWQL
jgi:hypothetical protein